MRPPKNVFFTHIFPLLFFEHEYLNNRELYILKILGMTGKLSDLVNCVSALLFRVWYISYDKKTGNFYPTILHYFSRFYQMRTRPYIKNQRQSPLNQNVFSVH